jgi:hypothetical protein
VPERIDRAARVLLPARRRLRKTLRRLDSARTRLIRVPVDRIEALRGDLWRCEAVANGIGYPVSTAPEHGPQRYRLPVVDGRLLTQASLPGVELVEKGLSDLAKGRETVESLLVSIGSSRLRRLGFDVEAPVDDAEERLYLLLARDDPEGAHSRYNALVRRLVSFERAAESAR